MFAVSGQTLAGCGGRYLPTQKKNIPNNSVIFGSSIIIRFIRLTSQTNKVMRLKCLNVFAWCLPKSPEICNLASKILVALGTQAKKA